MKVVGFFLGGDKVCVEQHQGTRVVLEWLHSSSLGISGGLSGILSGERLAKGLCSMRFHVTAQLNSGLSVLNWMLTVVSEQLGVVFEL